MTVKCNFKYLFVMLDFASDEVVERRTAIVAIYGRKMSMHKNELGRVSYFFVDFLDKFHHDPTTGKTDSAPVRENIYRLINQYSAT